MAAKEEGYILPKSFVISISETKTEDLRAMNQDEIKEIFHFRTQQCKKSTEV